MTDAGFLCWLLGYIEGSCMTAGGELLVGAKQAQAIYQALKQQVAR